MIGVLTRAGQRVAELAQATDRLGDPWKAACEVFGT